METGPEQCEHRHTQNLWRPSGGDQLHEGVYNTRAGRAGQTEAAETWGESQSTDCDAAKVRAQVRPPDSVPAATLRQQKLLCLLTMFSGFWGDGDLRGETDTRIADSWATHCDSVGLGPTRMQLPLCCEVLAHNCNLTILSPSLSRFQCVATGPSCFDGISCRTEERGVVTTKTRACTRGGWRGGMMG